VSRSPHQSLPHAAAWLLGALLVALPLLPAARLAQAKDSSLRQRGTPEPRAHRIRRRRAIRRGCDFLCGKPGSVPESPAYHGTQRGDGAFGDNKAAVALTALAVLALMSDGSTDGRGRHGVAVKHGINFLLGRIEENRGPNTRWHEGYFWYAQDISSRMHGQGFATLALATALGTSEGKRARHLRAALKKAVACIEYAQNDTGGFGYQPVPSASHEGSVTVAVAQGLRAARDAGILVSDETIRKGLNYLRKSQKRDGSFQYSLNQNQSSYALTAAALSSFFLYGHYKDGPDRSIQRGLAYLRERLSKRVDVPWFYYGHFYGAWTCWQWDGHTWDTRGDHLWAWWQERVYPELFDRQLSNGSFQANNTRYDYGPVLSTAFAVLTLAIPDEVLPIFQR